MARRSRSDEAQLDRESRLRDREREYRQRMRALERLRQVSPFFTLNQAVALHLLVGLLTLDCLRQRATDGVLRSDGVTIGNPGKQGEWKHNDANTLTFGLVDNPFSNMGDAKADEVMRVVRGVHERGYSMLEGFLDAARLRTLNEGLKEAFAGATAVVTLGKGFFDTLVCCVLPCVHLSP